MTFFPDGKRYDWEQMSEKEKAEAAANVGLPVKEVDNRLREKSVETKMEFNIEGDEKATSKLQKSAQAMIDAYGGNMSKSGFDRDIKLFEDAYGEKMANMLVAQLRPKTDSNVSAPEGSKSTMGGLNIPSEEELMSTNKDQLEQKLIPIVGFVNDLKKQLAEEEKQIQESEQKTK